MTQLPSSPFTIADAPPEAGNEIEAQLLRALRSELPQATNTGFVLTAKDHPGMLVGGLVAGTSYGWLLTKCLWVAQGHRKAGLGRSLMSRAEDKGRELGCHAAWLDTSSPAAMAFYTQLGYTPFGQLTNRDRQHPPTHQRWFMQKAL